MLQYSWLTKYVVAQDEVGGLLRIIVAEDENGQVIAVRLYCGMEDWAAEGSEYG